MKDKFQTVMWLILGGQLVEESVANSQTYKGVFYVLHSGSISLVYDTCTNVTKVLQCICFPPKWLSYAEVEAASLGPPKVNSSPSFQACKKGKGGMHVLVETI